MRFGLALLLIISASASGVELWDVMKSAEVDAKFAKIQDSLDVVMKPNYAVVFRVSSGKPAAWQIHPEADELWFVRRGSAKVSLNDYTLMAGLAGGARQQYDIAGGDVMNVPRDKAYQITPGAGRFEYVSVRIFPTERHVPRIGSGGGAQRRPMPTVVTKSEIDAKLGSADKIENLHSSGTVIINYIVAPPAWPKPSIPESHMTCDDFYFLRLGTALAAVDGYIFNAKEQPAGEIHGSNAVGAREYPVGPGDLVSIPRNTMHYMAPESARFGYLLVKICE